MRICTRFGAALLVVVGLVVVSALRARQITAHSPQVHRSAQQDRVAIERLHQQDVEATLSGKADDFAMLWDKDAVRIQPSSPAEIGKAVIYATDFRLLSARIRGYDAMQFRASR